MKTIGQKRVKTDFNPEKNELVDQIQNKSAELIDLTESIKEVGSQANLRGSERNRLIAIAQTHFETAAMYAVKANFTD
jgi:hypothetical protein